MHKPNDRTGQVLSERSLSRRTKIESKEITMIYGIGAIRNKTKTGVPLSTYTRRDHAGEQINNKTDIEKA